MVLLFLAGIVCGIRYRFFLMLLSWVAFDAFLNIILGFGINEVYIMTSGWAFIVPVSFAYLLKRCRGKARAAMTGVLLLLTCYLWIYNGTLIVKYLTTMA